MLRFAIPFLLLGWLAPAWAQEGASVYAEHCAGCHNSGAPRMPALAALQSLSAEVILRSLESGVMQQQGRVLTPTQRRAVATYLGKADVSVTATHERCSGITTLPVGPSPDGWNGWGNHAGNWRFQPQPGLTTKNAPRLRLRWAYGFAGATVAFAQPTLAHGRLYFGSRGGAVTSVDAATGCLYWQFQADAPVRTAIVLDEEGRAFFGDLSGNAYALASTTGQLLWKTKLDSHQHARVTAAPALHEGRLYFPVSSLEEGIASDPAYPCCSFRGSVVSLEAATGKQVWKTYTIQEAPKQVGQTAEGTPRFSPSGIGVWVTPTIDAVHRRLYIVTGGNYTQPSTPFSDSFLALSLADGRVEWAKQITARDVWNVSCISPGRANCPAPEGPDADFGSAAILLPVGKGKRLLISAQKDSVVTAVDPDRRGTIVWQRKLGKGGLLGGVQWGGASDGQRLYFPLSDYGLTVVGRRQYGPPDPRQGGGLFALQAATGKLVWQAPPVRCAEGKRGCSPAQSAAVTVAGGLVLSGGMDGGLRIHNAQDGKLLFSFDTTQRFTTVNGVEAQGGSIDAAGPVAGEGMVFVTSGYSIFGGMPGNVLLAFGPE